MGGCDKLPHGGDRTLYQHLCGVEDLLAKAGRPVHEQIAGLYHSIYGTDNSAAGGSSGYGRSAGLVTRAEVVKVIGFEAETLAFLFCNLKHRDDIISCIFDEQTNQSLLWLEYTNLLEMDLHEFGEPDDPKLRKLARIMATKPPLERLAPKAPRD